MSPQLMAHRGNSTLAPENTLAAFAKCLESDPEWIELDVHPTADGEIIVMHDATVDRTTNGQGAIAGLTLAQLRALDAGSWFSPDYAGERVPTLAEVVDLVGNRSRLNVEIKQSPPGRDVPGMVVNILRQGGSLKQSMISSFNLEAVLATRSHWAESRLALITSHSADLARVIEHRLPWLNLHYGAVDAPLIARAHKAGVRVTIWTMDDPGLWESFAAMGVDVICTNAPHLMPRP